MSEREFMTKCAMGQASTIGVTVLNPFKPTFILLRNILLYTHCCQEAELYNLDIVQKNDLHLATHVNCIVAYSMSILLLEQTIIEPNIIDKF